MNQFLKDKAFGDVAEKAVSLLMKQAIHEEPDIFNTNKCDLGVHLKIEVKSDRLTKKTGNVAVETHFKEKPSGINVTEAQIWVWRIEEDYWWSLSEDIKAYIGEHEHELKVVQGGDKDNSRIVLVPFYDFYTKLAHKINE